MSSLVDSGPFAAWLQKKVADLFLQLFIIPKRIEKASMATELKVDVPGQGLHDITTQIRSWVQQSGVDVGVCHLFIQHTSASLLVQENYDPSAKADLENWLNRLVPENDPIYTHTLEGADDMPAHIKAALTACSLTIPSWPPWCRARGSTLRVTTASSHRTATIAPR